MTSMPKVPLSDLQKVRMWIAKARQMKIERERSRFLGVLVGIKSIKRQKKRQPRFSRLRS